MTTEKTYKAALQESAEMIKMLLILAAGCREHPGFRGRNKPHRPCDSCDIIWQTATAVRTVMGERADKLKKMASERLITPVASLLGPDGDPVKA